VGVLRLVTDIAAPVDVCFDLSRSIDLHVESMAASQERAVAGVTSGLIGAGERVTWEARHLGRRWRVTSCITEYDRPRRFVDEMVEAGPFAFFRHEHLFGPISGGTRMTDVIEFGTRYRPVAPLLDLAAGAYLRRLIVTRNACIRSRAETA
jgi:ligand-binding SRPBCC domain-containing protein